MPLRYKVIVRCLGYQHRQPWISLWTIRTPQTHSPWRSLHCDQVAKFLCIRQFMGNHVINIHTDTMCQTHRHLFVIDISIYLLGDIHNAVYRLHWWETCYQPALALNTTDNNWHVRHINIWLSQAITSNKSFFRLFYSRGFLTEYTYIELSIWSMLVKQIVLCVSHLILMVYKFGEMVVLWGTSSELKGDLCVEVPSLMFTLYTGKGSIDHRQFFDLHRDKSYSIKQ